MSKELDSLKVRLEAAIAVIQRLEVSMPAELEAMEKRMAQSVEAARSQFSYLPSTFRLHNLREELTLIRDELVRLES